MPEMPEVEQVRKTLAPRITNKKITSVEVYLDRLVKHPTVEKFVEGLTGKSILEVGRKGKYLVLKTDENQKLIVHLRMTGALIAQDSEQDAPPCGLLIFALLARCTLLLTTMPTSMVTKL